MYDSLLEGRLKDLDWLYVDDSILSPGKVARQKWIDDCQILCKVGMTTKSSVSTRLLEWQNTCKHTVLNLTPDKVDLLCNRNASKKKGLSKMFERLSLKPTKKNQSATVDELKTYQNGGFYVDGKGKSSLQQIENAIHRLLWKRYGQGLIYCYGCDPTGQKRHKEWFRVTIKELPLLLKMMDATCLDRTVNS